MASRGRALETPHIVNSARLVYDLIAAQGEYCTAAVAFDGIEDRSFKAILVVRERSFRRISH
jgi:hypothetical protein